MLNARLTALAGIVLTLSACTTATVPGSSGLNSGPWTLGQNTATLSHAVAGYCDTVLLHFQGIRNRHRLLFQLRQTVLPDTRGRAAAPRSARQNSKSSVQFRMTSTRLANCRSTAASS